LSTRHDVLLDVRDRTHFFRSPEVALAASAMVIAPLLVLPKQNSTALGEVICGGYPFTTRFLKEQTRAAVVAKTAAVAFNRAKPLQCCVFGQGKVSASARGGRHKVAAGSAALLAMAGDDVA
jgi:hypothetical protein